MADLTKTDITDGLDLKMEYLTDLYDYLCNGIKLDNTPKIYFDNTPKIYTVNITQTGEEQPNVNVLFNSFPANFAWGRTLEGTYVLCGIGNDFFNLTNGWALPRITFIDEDTGDDKDILYLTTIALTDNVLQITVVDANGNLKDIHRTNTPISFEVCVYMGVNL